MNMANAICLLPVISSSLLICILLEEKTSCFHHTSCHERTKHTKSATPGFPGGNLGREGGRGGGGGGVVLLEDAKGVAGRAGEDDPEINIHYIL